MTPGALAAFHKIMVGYEIRRKMAPHLSLFFPFLGDYPEIERILGGADDMAKTHIALDVSNVDQAVRFYQAFLGMAPFRVLPGYAQFLLDDPALNLALTERNSVTDPRGHFGLEVPTLTMVEQRMSRARDAGLNPEMESDSLCCHARQEKFWVHDPDGHRWEVFWVRMRFMQEQHDSNDMGCCTVI